VIGGWWIPRTLLEQSIEELPTQGRVAPIEPKSEFIKIRLELLFGWAALKSAKQPSFEQRSYTMNSWQLFTAGSRDASMSIAITGKPTIGPCSVTDNHGAFNNGFLYEVNDSGAIVIRNLGEPDSSRSLSADFSSNYYDFLCLSCGIPWRQSANESFVYFNISRKLFASRPDHGPAQLVQHNPCRFVTGEAEQSLQPHRVDAHFLVSHPPHGSIPQPQRDLAAMKDGPGREIGVGVAALAMKKTLLGAPCLPSLASGANEPIRPTNSFEVIPA
jgi:hypothetical protein